MISSGKVITAIIVVIVAVAKAGETTESFVDNVCKAFAEGDMHKVVGYTMEDARDTMSNSLDLCQCRLQKFKGREMLVQVAEARHCYDGEVLKSVETALPEGAELYWLNLIAFPLVKPASCQPVLCSLHFVKNKNGGFGLLGNAWSGYLLSGRDVDMLFKSKSIMRYGMSCDCRSFSDNPYLWRKAKWIQDSLNTDTEDQIRTKLSYDNPFGLSAHPEVWRIVSAARSKGQEFRVIPSLDLDEVDTDAEFLVWSVKSGSCVGLRPELTFKGCLNEDGSCSIKGVGFFEHK